MKKVYEEPNVEVIEVEVEQGFATSGNNDGSATGPGETEWD